jgi:uncharacterized membrane protein YgaE (UPF0421/DUF939 family)
MRFKLSPSARLGTQAAIAIILAFTVAQLFGISRSYWALMTAMLLISQTWGESVRKAFTRAGMTILGGIVGTLIYFLIKSDPHVIFIGILLCVFFMVYFFETSYLLTVFFITMFVVFLFAAIDNWSIHLLEARIYDTLIGAGIAIISSALVFPITAKTGFINQFPEYIEKLKKCTNVCFALFDKKEINDREILTLHKDLLGGLLQLQTSQENMNYEYLFNYYPKKTRKEIMLNISILHHYVTSSMEAYASIRNSPNLKYIESDLKEIQGLFNNNFTLLIEILDHKKPRLSFLKIIDIRERIQKEVIKTINSSCCTEASWFDFFSFFYFLRKVNGAILELTNILGFKET